MGCCTFCLLCIVFGYSIVLTVNSRDQPNSQEKIHNFMQIFKKYAQFHRDSTKFMEISLLQGVLGVK